MKNECTIAHVNNMSDHLPLSMSLYLSIDNLTKFKEREFKLRIKWNSATSTIMRYKIKLDSFLMLIQLPFC